MRRGESRHKNVVRELPGGLYVALVHKGTYAHMGTAYDRILAHVRDRGCAVLLSTRAVDLKGAGMESSGNPQRYLTGIQTLVAQNAIVLSKLR